MKGDPRYAQWLAIADELKSLHSFLYGPGGFLAGRGDRPYRPTGPEAAHWIRRKCETGWWYWWDSGWLGGCAEGPLRSLHRVIGDSGGFYESTEAGRAVISRIESLREQISALSK